MQDGFWVRPKPNKSGLAQLRHHGSVDTYVAYFKRWAVMVPDVSERRLTYLFMEGLREPLRGLVKAFYPESLQAAIKRALTLETTTPSRSFQGSTTRNVSTGTPQQQQKVPHKPFPQRLGAAPSRLASQHGPGQPSHLRVKNQLIWPETICGGNNYVETARSLGIHHIGVWGRGKYILLKCTQMTRKS